MRFSQMTDLSAKFDKSLKALEESKIERYEYAVIKHILKHIGVKTSVPENPGVNWLQDEVPEWGLGSPEVHALRLEHDWTRFLVGDHPLEKYYSKLTSNAIVVFKWLPTKFMVLVDEVGTDRGKIITGSGLEVCTLDSWLETKFPSDVD